MKHTLPLLLALAALTSCSITKREYMPGYDVQWVKAEKQTTELASVSEAKPVKKLTFPKILLAGDTIITKKGDTIFCKIIKQTDINIFYTEKNVTKSIVYGNVQYCNVPEYVEKKRKEKENKSDAPSEGRVWAVLKWVILVVLVAAVIGLILWATYDGPTVLLI